MRFGSGCAGLGYLADLADVIPWIIVASAAGACALLAAVFGKPFLEALWELISPDL